VAPPIPDPWWGSNESGLHPAGRYAVNTNAWSDFPNSPKGYHPDFHGRDHTNNTVGARNFMMFNGSDIQIPNPPPPHQAVIWQQTVTVIPGRAYYFSAWAMNLHPDENARLQFEINGIKEGDTLDLFYAPKPTNEAQVDLSNWDRFYNTGLWICPVGVDTATIRIINLNPNEQGNDFALDDISFGLLSSVPNSSGTSVNGGGPVCAGQTLNLSVNVTGGTPPYTYLWTYPDGFTTSTDPTIAINNVQQINGGVYSLVVTDVNGCTSATSNTTVTVTEYPVAPTSAQSDRTSVCAGDPGTITLSVTGGSGATLQWFTGSCGGTLIGTGPSLPVTAPATTTTYYARWMTACGISTCATVTVTVNSIPTTSPIYHH
jgi:hypothetical protein